MKLLATKKFEAMVIKEYSITPTVQNLGNCFNELNLYKIDNREFFLEWFVTDLNNNEIESAEIGIWVDEKNNVTDYDGIFSLPTEIVDLLKEHNIFYDVSLNN